MASLSTELYTCFVTETPLLDSNIQTCEKAMAGINLKRVDVAGI